MTNNNYSERMFTVNYLTMAVQSIDVKAENEADAIKKAKEAGITDKFYNWCEQEGEFEVKEIQHED